MQANEPRFFRDEATSHPYEMILTIFSSFFSFFSSFCPFYLLFGARFFKIYTVFIWRRIGTNAVAEKKKKKNHKEFKLKATFVVVVGNNVGKRCRALCAVCVVRALPGPARQPIRITVDNLVSEKRYFSFAKSHLTSLTCRSFVGSVGLLFNRTTDAHLLAIRFSCDFYIFSHSTHGHRREHCANTHTPSFEKRQTDERSACIK